MEECCLHIDHTVKGKDGRVEVRFGANEDLAEDCDFWISFGSASEVDPVLRVLFSARKLLAKPEEPSFQMEMFNEAQTSC